MTFLKLAKSPDQGFNPMALLPRLLPVYEQLPQKLELAGANWVQIDEPALVLDLNPNERAAFQVTCQQRSTDTSPRGTFSDAACASAL